MSRLTTLPLLLLQRPSSICAVRPESNNNFHRRSISYQNKEMSRNIGSTQSSIVPSFPEDPLQSPIDDLKAILNITHPRRRPADGTEEEDPPEVNPDSLPARNIIDIRFSEDETRELLRALVALRAAQEQTDRTAIRNAKNRVKKALTSFHKMAKDMLQYTVHEEDRSDDARAQPMLKAIEQWGRGFQKDNRRLLGRLFPGPLTINRKSEKNTTATNRHSTGIRLSQEVNSSESQHEPRASQDAGPQQAWSNVSYAPTNASYVPEDDEIRSLDGSSNLDTEAATTNVPDITEDAPLLEGAVDSTMNSRFSVRGFFRRRAQSPKKAKRPRPPSSSNNDRVILENLSAMGFPGLSNLSSGHY